MTCILPQPDRPVVISEGQPDYVWSATHDFGYVTSENLFWSLYDVPHVVEGQVVQVTIKHIGNEGGPLDGDASPPYYADFHIALVNTPPVDIARRINSSGDCMQVVTFTEVTIPGDVWNSNLDNPPSTDDVPQFEGQVMIGVHTPYGLLSPPPECMGEGNVFEIEIAYLAEGDVVAGETLRAWTEELCPTAIFARTPELDDAGQTTGRWRFITTHPIRANGAEYVGFNADPCKHHLARRVVGDNGQCWVEYCSTPHGDHDQFKRAHRAGRCIGPVDGAGIEDGQAAWAGTYHAPFWTETIMSSQPQVCDVTV